MKNYPNTIQLGDVTQLDLSTLPQIDLLIGGSPCQGFSNAGKGLNFDDQRSKLFFTYVDVLKYLRNKNPNLHFLLENVKMKKEYRDVISKCLGVEPIEINSSLVSAQNRKRLYWTNIPFIEQPNDKSIHLIDIIDGTVDSKNSFCTGNSSKEYFESHKEVISLTQKFSPESSSLSRMLKSTKALNEKANCMTATMYKGMASNGVTNIIHNGIFRMLSPIECERLQTLPDNYTEGICKTNRYKTIGNGWTVDVITHILNYINKNK